LLTDFGIILVKRYNTKKDNVANQCLQTACGNMHFKEFEKKDMAINLITVV